MCPAARKLTGTSFTRDERPKAASPSETQCREGQAKLTKRVRTWTLSRPVRRFFRTRKFGNDVSPEHLERSHDGVVAKLINAENEFPVAHLFELLESL